MSNDVRGTLEEAQLAFAKRIHGRVWALLDKSDRTPLEAEEMLHAAHASLFHWLSAGTGLNHQRGEWLIARVHAVLGNAPEALRHAGRCQELTDQHSNLMEDFDIAFAHECVARANAVAGNLDVARDYLSKAEASGARIRDADDRKVFFESLHGGNWNGAG